jgi:Uri superfamily endonuclease
LAHALSIQSIPNKPGVYTLIINVVKPVKIHVGGLGLGEFPAGIYAYTGSALGKDAFNLKERVERHLKTEKEKNWHIDYLLIPGSAKLAGVVASVTKVNRECTVSSFLERSTGVEVAVKGFGSQDCRSGCRAHLQFFPKHRYSEVLDLILAAHRNAGLKPILAVDLE